MNQLCTLPFGSACFEVLSTLYTQRNLKKILQFPQILLDRTLMLVFNTDNQKCFFEHQIGITE